MAIERAPAFQFYPKEFLSSSKVIAMTMTERGVYITLLATQWLDGSLPNDLEALARLVGVPAKQFSRMWPHNLARCFEECDGRLVNARLERERQKQADYRAGQAERGKASAVARSQRKGNAGSTSVHKPLEPDRNSASVSATPVQRPSGAVAPRRTPLVIPSKAFANVSRFSPLGDVPNQLHSEFLRKVMNAGVLEDEAERQLKAFYEDVERRFAGEVVGEGPLVFWRARFAESAGAAVAPSTATSTHGAREFIRGTR